MTATIPFDRVFSVSAEQLKVSYLVSLRQLLGPPSTLPSAAEIPAAVAAVAEPEAEAEESAAESDHDKMADIDADAENGKSTKPSKKRKAKKRRELEYDLDDPFIDDSAMTEVYRSVFDLMGDAGAMEAAMAAADADEGFGVDAAIGAGDEDGGRTGQALFGHTSKQQPSFFVYRGPLSNEILAK